MNKPASPTKQPGPTLKSYLGVWAALMALLVLTWGVAQVNLGRWNAVAALTIAVIKMLLVILIFMHVRYSSKIIWLFAAAGFIWLLIMIDLTLSDFLTRDMVKSAGPKAFQNEQSSPSQSRHIEQRRLPGRKP